jgi:hypothetical protein
MLMYDTKEEPTHNSGWLFCILNMIIYCLTKAVFWIMSFTILTVSFT